MTRARDELYVCGYKIHRDSPENSWYRLVEEALHQDLLRAVESPDGSSCLRQGPDPTWIGMAPVLQARPRGPAWLFKNPNISHHGWAAAPGRRDLGSRAWPLPAGVPSIEFCRICRHGARCRPEFRQARSHQERA